MSCIEVARAARLSCGPGGYGMEYIAYLRDQAESFRRMAATAPDPDRARELRELAETCEEIAEEWEARQYAG